MRLIAAIRRRIRDASERDLFTPADIAFWEMVRWARHPWDGPLSVAGAPPTWRPVPNPEYVKLEFPNLYEHLHSRGLA